MRRVHRGRIQAQGGGTEKSVKWAQDGPLTVAEAMALVERLKAVLTPAESRARGQAFAEAHEYIQRVHRAGGVEALQRKTFPRVLGTDEPRVDIEITSGIAFI